MGKDVSTIRFSVSSGEYTKVVFTEFFRKWWWCYALPITATISLMTLNVNFVIVLLVLVFIVFPMSLSFVFFSYCMMKEVRWSILPKVVTLKADGLYLLFDEFTKKITWTEITDYRIIHGMLRLKLKANAYFIIPYSAFRTNDDLRELIKAMNESIPKHRPITQ